MASSFFSEKVASAASAAQSFLSNDDPLVGRTVRVQHNSVVVNKVLAEGGFGKVYLVSDAARGGQQYVLKRMYIQGEESKQQVKQEIEIMSQLKHENVIEFLGYSTAQGNQVFLLMEYCPGGHLLDVINSLSLSEVTTAMVLNYFTPMVKAVAHMHAQNPPIAHRDLKFENVLISRDRKLKLCDFGSASRRQGKIKSKKERTDEEDIIERFTTPMFRAPEMIDLYSGHPIDERVDVWALGCILYSLMYLEHPFQDTGTLAIVSWKVKLKSYPEFPTKLKDLVHLCFRHNPEERPTADSIARFCESFKQALRKGENLDSVRLPQLVTKDGQDCMELMEETTVNEMDDMFARADIGSQKPKKKGKKKKNRDNSKNATKAPESSGNVSAVLQRRLQGSTQQTGPIPISSISSTKNNNVDTTNDTNAFDDADAFDPFGDVPGDELTDIWGSNEGIQNQGGVHDDEFDPFGFPSETPAPERQNRSSSKATAQDSSISGHNDNDADDILGAPTVTQEEDLLGAPTVNTGNMRPYHSQAYNDGFSHHQHFMSAPGRTVGAHAHHPFPQHFNARSPHHGFSP